MFLFYLFVPLLVHKLLKVLIFVDIQQFPDNAFIALASIILTEAQIGGVHFGHPPTKRLIHRLKYEFENV